MKLLKSIFAFIVIAGIAGLYSCGGDDEPDAVTLVSLVATGNDVLSGNAVTVDLNGATTATGVPINPTITATFSKELDETTVSATNLDVTIAGTAVTANVSVSGAVVTVTFSDELVRGTDYVISMSGNLKASDGGVFTAATRTFTTGGVAPVTPPHVDAQVAYWPFDGNTDDATGNYSTALESEIEFITDRHGQVASTVSFDGDASLIEIAGADELLNTADFTLSFWMKSNSSDKNDNDETRGQFVMGLAAWNGFQFEIFGNYGGCKLAAQYTLDDDAVSGQDLWWSTRGDLGWQGWTFDKDVSASGGLAGVIADKWVHVVVSYNATTKVGAMYMNGELVKSQDFNLYGETHPMYRVVGMGYNGNPAPGNRLAFGFIQGSENRIVSDDWANPIGFPDNNHFKGELDDIRVFHAAFSATDVADLYNDEKPN